MSLKNCYCLVYFSINYLHHSDLLFIFFCFFAYTCVYSLVLTKIVLNLAFYLSDSAVNEAAKILRLLHISQLRELQTRINEAIVAVQAITADPKTDQSLGRLGVIGK